MTESSVQMVLLEYQEFARLKKTQEDYRKLLAENSKNEKRTTKPEVRGNSQSEELKGHGSGDSYKVSVADPIPQEFVDKQATDDSNILSLVPKKYQSSATQLVDELKKKDSIQWCSDNGELSINKKVIPGSKIKEILPKVFSGLRSGHICGEQDFMDYLQENNLQNHIKSVKAKDWYYIGKP